MLDVPLALGLPAVGQGQLTVWLTRGPEEFTEPSKISKRCLPTSQDPEGVVNGACKDEVVGLKNK